MPPPESRKGSAETRHSTAVTQDSLHWQKTATTLLAENTQIRNALQLKEKECSDLTSKMFQLGQAYIELEKQLALNARELLILRADVITPPAVRGIPSIPVTTQGKDAMYWHQACRTLQMQFLELKNELDSKTDQFIRLTAAHRALLKKGSDECPPCTESPPSKDRPH
jgi:hypothetical protein